ncbi:Rta1 domain-containing protein [Pleurostoma richardsiae]|uniref:Rta1 domain-containing protein n=1 Tax=Pleurostoma richardsiae TaxID=41990 RepID=A0AA38R4E0_9PEZI|nr:Rta1 domain-containing protein [Pleurostoma richardsiae]
MADGTFVLYHYNPSAAAAIIFVVLFAICTILHLYKLVRFKTWHFIPFLIGCIFEAVGYAGRAVSANQTPNWTTMPYVIQSLLLLLGPTLLAASVYMTLGRLIILLEADSYAIIRPKRLTKFFVLGDVLSFLAQSGGGGMLAQAKTQDKIDLGEKVILVGLLIQILFFGFFMVVTLVFHRRIARDPTPQSLFITAPWMRYIYILYTASVFIMIRSVFRVAEYAGGYSGTLQSTEVYIYIFDATLMFIVAALFIIVHPSQIISKNKGALPLSESEGYAENVPMNARKQEQGWDRPQGPRPYQGAMGGY